MDAKVIDLNAAADYLGPGAIETPVFETEIMDIVRRSSVALQRFPSKPATGHPHRFFEQTAIATASAVDPRNLQNTTSSGPTRVERPAFIKAVSAQTNLSLFDKEVTQQQNQFAAVVAKDVDDVVAAIEVKRGSMLWKGSDTSLSAPTTLEWMGAIPQVALQGGIVNFAAPGVSIIDTVKTTVAQLLAQQGYVVRPSAIYVNPLTADAIDQEAKAAHIDLKTQEVVAGVSCKYISTQAGDLPIVSDPFMPVDSTSNYGLSITTGYKNYYVMIMMESETEIPVISGQEHNPNPRIFQLGLVGNLAGQFVGIKFDTLIVKGATYAHALVVVQR